MKLRALEKKDMAGMLEWMSTPDIQQNFLFDSDKKKVLDFIQKSSTNVLDGKSIHYAIADEKSDEYLGTISLKEVNIVNKNAEYAISLRKMAQGRGIATEATKEILRLAFEELGFERVYLNVFSDNINAIRLYEKCGFLLEGEFRNHVFVRGKYRSLKWYSMLKNEYNHIYLNNEECMNALEIDRKSNKLYN